MLKNNNKNPSLWVTIYQYLILCYVVFVLLFPKISLIKLSSFATPVRIEDFLLLILILFGLVLFGQNENFRKKMFTALSSPISVLIISWISLMFVSTTYNIFINQISVSNYLFVLRFVEYVVLFYLGYITVANWRFHLICINTLVAIGILTSVWAVLQITGIVGGYGGGFYQYSYIKGTDRAFASFSGPYELAGFLIILIPITAGMFVITKNVKLKLFYLAALTGAIITMGLSGARFPVFCSFLATLSLIFANRELKYKAIVVFLAVLTITMPLLVSKTLVLRLEFLAKTVESFREEEAIAESLQPVAEPTEPTKPTSQKTVISPSPTTKGKITPVVEKTATGELPQETREKSVSPLFKLKEKSLVSLSGLIEKVFDVVDNLNEKTLVLADKIKEKDPSLRWRLAETWPRAIGKVKKNPLLAGGMGSIGVGLDGEYATLLGEIGIVGLTIFVVLLWKIIRVMRSQIKKSKDYQMKVILFVIISITIGLAANAVFADIFRASKVAMLFWYLVGISIGTKNRST